MILFHHQLLAREGGVVGQWMYSSIVHDSVCELFIRSVIRKLTIVTLNAI